MSVHHTRMSTHLSGPPVHHTRAAGAASQKIRLIQLPGYPAGRIDQSYMTIGLREISPLRTIGSGILTKNAQVIAERQQLIQVAHGIIHPAHTGQGIYIPKSTYEEG